MAKFEIFVEEIRPAGLPSGGGLYSPVYKQVKDAVGNGKSKAKGTTERRKSQRNVQQNSAPLQQNRDSAEQRVCRREKSVVLGPRLGTKGAQ